jgi:integrase/recombinase XerD
MNSIELRNTDLTQKDFTIPLENVKYWEKDFINEHLQLIKNKTHKTLFMLLWRTGVRVSEALSLERKHIDLDNYTITIRWLKKRKAMHRVIPMHPDLRNILDYYVHSLKKEDKLFPFSRQRADQLVKEHFSGNCHKFRHSFAVNWLRCGGDLYLLSRMLGHSSIKVTEIYLEIVPIDIGKELLKIQF